MIQTCPYFDVSRNCLNIPNIVKNNHLSCQFLPDAPLFGLNIHANRHLETFRLDIFDVFIHLDIVESRKKLLSFLKMIYDLPSQTTHTYFIIYL